MTTTISRTNNLKVVNTNRVPPSVFHGRVRGLGRHADGPFNYGVVLVSPFMGRIVRMIIRRHIPIVAANTNGPNICIPTLGRVNAGIVPMITSMLLTGHLLHNNVSTVVTRNARSNNRMNSVAAVTLVPRMISTMSMPIVTTNNVTSNHNVTTTFTLNTGTMRVKAQFMLSRRYVTRRGCGGTMLGTGSHTAIVANLAANRPMHVVSGTLTRGCGSLRFDNNSGRRLRTLNTNALHLTTVSNGVGRNSMVVNRVSNVLASIGPYRAVVGSVVARTRAIVGGLRNLDGWKNPW